MEPIVRSNHHFRFRVFSLDPQTRELFCNGVKQRIHGQPLEVLAILIAHPGEMVTRDALQKALWPEGTFVDFENSLNNNIKRLREALGDDPGSPSFIETVPRLGYRFIAPVTPPGSGTTSSQVTEGPPLPERVSLAPSHPAVEGGASGKARAWSFLRMRWITGAAIGLLLGVAAILLGLNIEGLRDKLAASVQLPGNRASSQIKSLAVLPFEDLSSGPHQEYFADGMTEELTTSLASIRDIRVISRTSVMHLKGSTKALPEIASELNVDGIVEGTVARSGSHVRITANLLHAQTDRHLWANSYETDMEDLLVTENRVAQSIADALRVELAPRSSIALEPRRLNPEAYDAYLQGRYFTSKWTESGFEKAAASFRRSIDIDPTYAPAFDGLADLYSWLALVGLRRANDVFPLAKAAALKALELDDGLGDAHATLGVIKLQFDWDWSGAGKEFERAVQLAPGSSAVHFSYGTFLLAMGRRNEAVNEARKGLELDPLNPASNTSLGWTLYLAGRHDESIAQLKRTLELDPGFASAYMELGWNYAQKRMYSEAVLACQKAVRLEPGDQVVLGSCGMVYGLAGKGEDALRLLARLKKVSERSYLDPYNVMALYAGLGDRENAIHWLERAYREHSASLYAIKVEILPDWMRLDPRFQDLLHRMNFPA